MKKDFLISLLVVTYISVSVMACGSSAQLSNEAGGKGKVAKWYNSLSWLNGLKLIPHPSINQQEFSRQYHTNKTWWDEAFAFIKTHDLGNLKPGVYTIDSGNVIATISELTPRDKDQVNWEAHRDFNDLQYIIKGKATMGIKSLSATGVNVKVPYDANADTEVFLVDGETYYDALPGSFFIFSPKEIHRPAFKAAGYEVIKKIVIKVRVP